VLEVLRVLLICATMYIVVCLQEPDKERLHNEERLKNKASQSKD
jgi:hypothetical protein